MNVKGITDASKQGLGAVLKQQAADCRWHPVKYASRTTSLAESRWAPIELEFLAIFFALQRFYTYVWGQKVRVETDHKLLLGTLKTHQLNAHHGSCEYASSYSNLISRQFTCHDPLPVGIIAAAVGYLVSKLAGDKAEVNSIKLT